ncbi:MAG: hypothetical protein IJN54_04030 [Lachnospiraceae bacterium]|nr:hypothetical protein [Lachnospiraceae bacterium]
MWEKEYALRASDFDKYNHIKPSSVLDLFQDAAAQHAIETGVGYDDLIGRSYIWVLLKVKFKIISDPQKFQKVTVKTWPLEPNKFIYRREYCIENESGKRLIVGSSEWVIIHSEKRRLVPNTKLYDFADGFHPEMMFEEKLEKVDDFEPSGTPRIVNAGFCEIDVNNHVNNTKYANYVLDAVVPSEADELVDFQIDYRKEVLEGTELKIYHKKDENVVLAKGLNNNGDIMFACRLEYK